MNLTFNPPYDPRNSRDFSPMKIGDYLVYREPFRGTPHTTYRVMLQGRTVGKQISMPSSSDCASLARAFDRSLDADERQKRRKHTGKAMHDESPGAMTERLIDALGERAVTIAKLALDVDSTPNVISPILNRLAKTGRLLRTGAPGNYRFAVVSE
jgi:hypothetical protein